MYLIWSNEHSGWWKTNSMGYTPGLRNAGVYTRSQAITICKQALPTAKHTKLISEIPVRLEDIQEILKDETVPHVVMGDSLASGTMIQDLDDARTDPKPK